jgi:hypothetical protein
MLCQGYEFVRDAIRHCLFEDENITISGKLVDIFAVKVCVWGVISCLVMSRTHILLSPPPLLSLSRTHVISPPSLSLCLQVHHVYEVAMDAVLGSPGNAGLNTGHAPVVDDFLSAQQV